MIAPGGTVSVGRAAWRGATPFDSRRASRSLRSAAESPRNRGVGCSVMRQRACGTGTVRVIPEVDRRRGALNESHT